MESPNVPALRRRLALLGLDGEGVDRLLHTFNTTAFARVDGGAAGRGDGLAEGRP
jgi:hypothetical protein